MVYLCCVVLLIAFLTLLTSGTSPVLLGTAVAEKEGVAPPVKLNEGFAFGSKTGAVFEGAVNPPNVGVVVAPIPEFC